MAEIMQDKAQGIATVLNWMINLIISIITPYMASHLGSEDVGYIFVVSGLITAFGAVFIAAFMKETKGKTAQEIEEMFRIKDSDEQTLKSNLFGKS